jgi:hypothetical protein
MNSLQGNAVSLQFFMDEAPDHPLLTTLNMVKNLNEVVRTL